jgi:hypothetical protein
MGPDSWFSVYTEKLIKDSQHKNVKHHATIPLYYSIENWSSTGRDNEERSVPEDEGHLQEMFLGHLPGLSWRVPAWHLVYRGTGSFKVHEKVQHFYNLDSIPDQTSTELKSELNKF